MPREDSRWRLPAPETLLRALLVFVPLAAVSDRLHWGGLATFAFACLGIVPLAGLMGEATEHLASRLGAGVGGLLNATFGNIAELIIAFFALRRGLHDVVKASLTGSIIGNVLLVLGAAFLAGGLRREKQTFDRVAASVGSTLLTLAAIGLVVPAMFHFVSGIEAPRGPVAPDRLAALERGLSLEISIVLLVAYVLSLVFSLRTHKHLYRGDEVAEAHGHGAAWGPWRSVAALLAATALVAWMSEILVGAVGEAARVLGLTQVFVGVIVVAVIGNAAEHSTAILVAVRGKMDLAVHVAVGSSIQIALFVAPALVLVSYAVPGGPMDLRFTMFEVLSVAIAVGITNIVTQDGESNWFEGALMLAVYLVLGIAFYFLP